MAVLKVFRQFRIARLRDCEQFDEGEWRDAPGFVPGGDGYVLEWGIESVDDVDDDLALGVVFHSRRCAKCAAHFLASRGITPRHYHAMDDSESQRVRHDVIANLPW